MLETMCPNLSILTKVCLAIPVGTASVECSFSQMKMIKKRLRNRLGETTLSHLMKNSTESPETLSDEKLQQILDTGTVSHRESLCNLYFYLNCKSALFCNFTFNHYIIFILAKEGWGGETKAFSWGKISGEGGIKKPCFILEIWSLESLKNDKKAKMKGGLGWMAKYLVMKTIF